jgi:hypothetical protein
MSAQPVSVNLLDQPEFESSSVARLFNWAVTYGRYIMIGTEVIVLLAFISRFSLDRKLTDLREEIAQKQIILEANKGFEEEIIQLQNTTKQIRSIVDIQEKPLSIFYDISRTLPSDVTIRSYTQEANKLSLTLVAGTTNGFSLFLSRLQQSSTFIDIEVTEINKDPLIGTLFKIVAKFK